MNTRFSQPTARRTATWALPLLLAAWLGAQTTTEYTPPVPLRLNDSVITTADGVYVAHAHLPATDSEIVFSSDRKGTKGGRDLFRAQRQGLTSPYSGITNLAALNSTADEVMPFVAFGGLEMYFVRRSGCAYSEIYRSTRTKVTGSWGTPQKLGAPFNVKGRFYTNPTLTADGLQLFFVMRIG